MMNRPQNNAALHFNGMANQGGQMNQNRNFGGQNFGGGFNQARMGGGQTQTSGTLKKKGMF